MAAARFGGRGFGSFGGKGAEMAVTGREKSARATEEGVDSMRQPDPYPQLRLLARKDEQRGPWKWEGDSQLSFSLARSLKLEWSETMPLDVHREKRKS